MLSEKLSKNDKDDNSNTVGEDGMVCIGTIGHVDHGKTSLTSAITRVLNAFMPYASIDNCQEEKDRGITIVAKHIYYKTKTRQYNHVDCPGHADYVKNMIIGASQMDIAILVVDIRDGAMPQTIEHLNLIKSIGVPSVIIFYNKLDLVEDKDYIEMVIEETLQLVENKGYKDVQYVCGSALLATKFDGEYKDYKLNAEGKLVDQNNNLVDKNHIMQLGLPRVKQLMDKVDTLRLRERKIDLPFLMPIEEVYSIAGRGTVATGRVERGILKPGQEIEIVGNMTSNIKTTAISIEMFKKQYTKAIPGYDVGILLRGIDKKLVSRGSVLAAIGSIKPISQFKALIYVNSAEEQGRNTGFSMSYQPQFFIRSADVTGSFTHFEDDLEIINPGEWAKVHIKLKKAQAIEKDNTFIIRESNKTVAVGRITDIL